MEPQDREEAYLANAAGDEVTLPACPWNRKEAYLADIGDRINNLDQEIQDLENNPDVVDIVNTYADLQAYDKTKLTDNDIIRVLNDETKDGESTYYRYSAATQTFNYIGTTKQYTNFVGTDGTTAGQAGLVPAPAAADAGKFLKADGSWGEAGGDIKALTRADYDYPATGTKTAIAGYSLPIGLYRIAENLNFVFFHSQTGSGTRELPAGTLVVVGYYSPDTVAITAVEGNAIRSSWASREGSGSQINSYVTSAGLTTTIDTRVYTIAGRPSNLTTTDKSTIVAGVNELEGTKAEGVDYEEGDTTSLAYIKNRPFYSTTSFTPTSLGNATLRRNYDISWGTYPYDVYWSVMEGWSSDWNQLAGPIISAQSGEAGISTVLATIQADPTATVRVSIDQFQMSYMDMNIGDQVVLDVTCPVEGFKVGTHEYDDGGMTQTLYYAKGSLTFSNGTTTQTTKAMLIADAVNGYWTLLMEKPTDFDYYMEMFDIYDGYTEFFSLVGTEIVAKQLDAKYVPIDNSTITTNAQGKLVASGGPTVVQTTGTSTTDVMSQDAVTKTLFQGGNTANPKIGGTTNGLYATAYGHSSSASGLGALAVGFGATSTNGGIAIGPCSESTTKGVVGFSVPSNQASNYGYNNTRYRLLSGLYDGQSAHDAATKGQLDNAILNGGTTAPTTSTVGAVGTQYTYVDTTGATPVPHLMVCTAVDTSVTPNTYTWVDVMGSVANALNQVNNGGN